MHCSFPLLSDPGGTVGNSYGVVRPDGLCQRVIILVDPSGVVVGVRDIDTQSAQQGDVLLQMLDGNHVPH
jgi:alkyl hydroperoxide reductase subunit AhpC